MKILVINAGSSSIKSKLFEKKKDLEPIAKFHIDGIGLKQCKLIFKSENKNIGLKQKVKNHEEGIKLLLKTLKDTGTIENLKEIEVVGHRVVHGGEKYSEPVKIDARVIKTIDELSSLAPLHNPANLQAIKACKKLIKHAPQIAIFDTAFHQTMPEKAYLYGLPYEYYKKHNIRRYGFHGTSHKYVTETAIKILKKKNLKIISCHIGNGSSITASINGKSVDTSMGFTPLEGVMMGTRSGSIDPAIILHLQKELKMKPDAIDNLLNHESGLKGFSEISSDMRNIYAKYKEKDPRAILTIETLSYQIAKYLGAYTAAMDGLDAIIFTGGLGEKAFYVREKACSYLNHSGLKLNSKKNENCEQLISDSKSKIKVFVIPTNEEKEIASQALRAA
ncbi:MAG: acetate kinase [Nitrospirota bacterium]